MDPVRTAMQTYHASEKSATIMFFDGSCPLCNREVNHYRRIDQRKRIKWVDINQNMILLNAFNVSYQSAMRRLHVLTADGVLVTGAYAFAAVWLELPYYRWLAKSLYLCRALHLLDRLYTRFAHWRFSRKCLDNSCLLQTDTNP